MGSIPNLHHLIPFAVSIAAYFWIFIPMERQTLSGMVLKCWPIVSLQYFVYMREAGSKDKTGHGSYKSKILAGLVLSCVGDAFLDFPGYFLHGTASFAAAQICYIWAFGFKPLNLVLALKVFAVMSIPLYYVTPNFMKEDTLLVVTITMYAPLLKTMVWRSLARATSPDAKDKDWGKTFACIGGISFGLSDATLAINKYYMPVPYAQAIIMVTYYFAQFGIALSTIEPATKTSKKNGSSGRSTSSPVESGGSRGNVKQRQSKAKKSK